MLLFLSFLWAVLIICLCCLTIPTFDEEDQCMYKIALVGTLLCFRVLFTTTFDVWALYTSPHGTVSNITVFPRAEMLLDCARHYVPNLRKEWISIEHCLDEANIYFIDSTTTSRIVHKSHSHPEYPVAFVHSRLDKSSIFVTPIYDSLPRTEKALVLIHECAHLALNAQDYAYRWQPEYAHLTKEEHYKNADSYFDAVFYHCT